MPQHPKKLLITAVAGFFVITILLIFNRNLWPLHPGLFQLKTLTSEHFRQDEIAENAHWSASGQLFSPVREEKPLIAPAQEPAASDKINEGQQEVFSEKNEEPDFSTVEASDEIEAAMDVWNSEKYAFYRDEIGLDESEIDRVHKLSIKTGDSIQAVVSAMTSTPPKITEDDYHVAIERLHEEENQAVKNLVGDERHKKMLAFRDRWNSEIDSRFGIRLKVTGF